MARWIVPFTLSFVALLGGCEESAPLHIGSKDFTEQYVLAELVAEVAERQGIPVERSIPYGDTFQNMEAVKTGKLDLYIEYNGTGLVLLGQPAISDGDRAQARVRELYEPLGLKWGERFGFSNDYVLVMLQDRAEELGVQRISDLATVPDGVAFGIDTVFQERPLDGISPLVRRYGLNVSDTLVVEEGRRSELYQSLLEGQIDVAEGFSTDGQIADFGLVVLEDDLDFFPVYQPSPLIHAEAAKRFPKLSAALEELSGKIDVQTMRAMNSAVELEGLDYQTVAQRFLVEQGLIEEVEAGIEVEELQLAVGTLDEIDGTAGIALRAVRKAFPGRSVQPVRTPDPLSAAADGRARLALVSSEAFFTIEDGLPARNDAVEAVGVVGSSLAHVLVRRGEGIKALGDMSTLGVGVENGSSHHTAEMVLISLGLQDQVEMVPALYGSVDQQVADLAAGKIDGLLLMVSQGHELIADAMAQGDFELLPMPQWGEGNNLVRFPFLRLARIPAGTYRNQDSPVDTISAQLVLAGPAPTREIVGDQGPGTVIPDNVQAIPGPTVTALNESLGTIEQIDPALRVAAVLAPQTPEPAADLNPAPVVSAFNLVVVVVMIYLVYLFARPSRRSR